MKHIIALLSLAAIVGGTAPAFAQIGDGTGAFTKREDEQKEKIEQRQEAKAQAPVLTS